MARTNLSENPAALLATIPLAILHQRDATRTKGQEFLHMHNRNHDQRIDASESTVCPEPDAQVLRPRDHFAAQAAPSTRKSANRPAVITQRSLGSFCNAAAPKHCAQGAQFCTTRPAATNRCPQIVPDRPITASQRDRSPRISAQAIYFHHLEYPFVLQEPPPQTPLNPTPPPKASFCGAARASAIPPVHCTTMHNPAQLPRRLYNQIIPST